MNEIGQKLKELRNRKGLSQEDLAEAAGVNLRTIQRIENNQNSPHGKTLNLICHALEISIDKLVNYGKEEDYNLITYFHLSVLSFIFLPLGNIIIPFILWTTNKKRVIGLEEIGKKVINFQIVWTVISYITAFSILFFSRMEFSSLFISKIFNWIPILILVLIMINIILSIINAIASKRKKSKVIYPNLIRIVN